MNSFLFISLAYIAFSAEIIPAVPLELPPRQCLVRENTEIIEFCCDGVAPLHVEILEGRPIKGGEQIFLGGAYVECRPDSTAISIPTPSVMRVMLGSGMLDLNCSHSGILFSVYGAHCFTKDGKYADSNYGKINVISEAGLLLVTQRTNFEDTNYQYWYDNGMRNSYFSMDNRMRKIRFGWFWSRDGAPMTKEAWIEEFGEVHMALLYAGLPIPVPELRK